MGVELFKRVSGRGLGGQNERQLHTFRHPGEGSNTFYSTALGGQNERQLHTFRHQREGSNTFYSTALGGQNERQSVKRCLVQAWCHMGVRARQKG